MHVIYIHTNPKNGKPYVGWALMEEGQSPHDAMMRRWATHCKAAEQGLDFLFSRAILKYGKDAWTHEVLDVVSKRETAKHVEKLWIKERNTCALEPGGHGYNMTRGGDGGGLLGHEFTLEHRENLSKASKGKPKSNSARKNMSLAKKGKPSPFKGKHHTAQWIQEQSGENAPHAKLTEAKKLVIIERWENRDAVPVTQQQLAADNGVTQSTVSRLLNKKTWK